MANYYEYKIATSEDADKKITTFQWCDSDPILSVGHENGSINFYQTEAQVAGSPISKTGKICRRIAWKPGAKILVLGWDDGCITYWNSKESSPVDHNGIHRTPITLLKWSPDGDLFVSCDQSGVVAVWKPPSRGRLPKPIHHTLDKRFGRCCAFAPPVNCGNSKDSIKLHPIFLGTSDKSLYLIDDAKQYVFLKQFKNEIDNILFYDEASRLLILTDDKSLLQFLYKSDGSLEPISKLRLNIIGSKGVLQSDWIAPGLLATVSGDYSVKIWDIKYESNYSLTTTSCIANTVQTRKIIVGESKANNKFGNNTMSFNDNNSSNVMLPSIGILKRDEIYTFSFDIYSRILVATGKYGNIYMWKLLMKDRNTFSNDRNKSIETDWLALDPIINPDLNKDSGEISGNKQMASLIQWGVEGVFSVKYLQSTSIYRETVLSQLMNNNLLINQINSYTLVIESLANRNSNDSNDESKTENTPGYTPLIIKSTIRIIGFCVDENTLIIYSDRNIRIFSIQIDKSISQEKGSFDLERIRAVDIKNDCLYVARDRSLEIYNYSGIKKGEVVLTEQEGSITHLSINNNYLSIATTQKLVRIYDINRRDPRAITNGGIFIINSQDKTESPIIRSIKVNCKGDEVAIIANSSSGKIQYPDSRIYIYSTVLDNFLVYQVHENLHPVHCAWDLGEPYLLAVLTETNEGIVVDSTNIYSEEEYNKSLTVYTLYTNVDCGVKMIDNFYMNKEDKSLIGINVPFIYFGREYKGSALSIFNKKTMRDFLGFNVNDMDKATKRALLDFSYNLTIGNMDAAYNSVKSIRNKKVWENMAHMCIKTRRLDVALVCLGQLDHIRGSRSIRQVLDDKGDENEAIAMLAIQLGFIEEAKQIYEETGRYDLLNRLYQYSGQWGRAIELAKTKDRINLRSTYYNYAKHLENIDNIDGAIENYELANLAEKEVPRMLYSKKGLDQLTNYINSHGSNELFKWYGQLCESKGRPNDAMEYYIKGQDIQSQVRLLCQVDQYQQAEDIIYETKDMSASYYLARNYEQKGNVQKAIQYFKYAKKYGHAIYIAKEEGLDSEIMNLSLMSSKTKMKEIAKYFENKGDFEKAVTLYENSECLGLAIDICFQYNLFDKLQHIVENITDNADPQLVARCAEFFLKNGQHAKAIELYASSGNQEEALKMIEKYNIKLNGEIVERLSNISDDNIERKNDILVKIADLLQTQGFFKIATKLYAKAGFKVKAMMCLLKSGDTEKIIYFANVSRNKETYLLAANYLQTLDWHNDSAMMKNIIQFYGKAKALKQLALFYNDVATFDIEEYRNYQNALQSLDKGIQYLIKDGTSEDDENYVYLRQKKHYIEKYLQAIDMARSKHPQFINYCLNLIQEPNIEASIKIGDILSLIVDYCYSNQNYKDAYHYIEQMKKNGMSIELYFDRDCLQTIYSHVGLEYQEPQDDNAIPEDFS